MSQIIYSRGDQVVWLTEKTGHHTAVHRYFQGGQTYCSRAVPPDDRVIPFHPRYNNCCSCERMYERAEKYLEDHPEQEMEPAS